MYKCINFGNGNDHVGIGGIGNTENHSCTPLISDNHLHLALILCIHGNNRNANDVTVCGL